VSYPWRENDEADAGDFVVYPKDEMSKGRIIVPRFVCLELILPGLVRKERCQEN